MNCNHYHTKRLKFIKICIAKIQINRIQITQNTYIHYCDGTTKIKVLLLLLLFYLFVYWLAFQHSNAIHYSFRNERIYWSSRWVEIFCSLCFSGKFSYKNGITIMNGKKKLEKDCNVQKSVQCICQAARKKIMNNWLIWMVERCGKRDLIHLLYRACVEYKLHTHRLYSFMHLFVYSFVRWLAHIYITHSHTVTQQKRHCSGLFSNRRSNAQQLIQLSYAQRAQDKLYGTRWRWASVCGE